MSDTREDRTEAIKQAQRQFRRGEFANAIRQFQEILETEPNEIRAHNGIAAAYFQLNQLDEAATHYKRVTQLDLRSGVPWINLGAVLNAQEKYQDAVSTLRKGLAKEKRSALGFYNLGLAHAGLKQPTMALSGFKEALNVDPEFIDAHLALANTYEDLNNHQLAIAHYQKALAINPDSRRARAGLQAAKDASDEARHAISPFGRLVDVNNLGPKSSVAVNRTLTTEEQVLDRHAVRTLATDLLVTTQELLKQISSELEPSVLGINRALAEGGSSPGFVLGCFDRFRDSIKSFQEHRKLMRRKILEIRAHEEVINTPDFTAFAAEAPVPPPADGTD